MGVVCKPGLGQEGRPQTDAHQEEGSPGPCWGLAEQHAFAWEHP